MTLLDRYLGARFVGSLLRTLVALVMLYILIDFIAGRQSDIAGKDVPFFIIFQYYWNMLPQLIYRMMPLSVLLAGLLVFGDAAQHNEITAALAAGISMRRITRVPIAIALLVAGGIFMLDQTVGAEATRTARGIESNYFKRNPDAARAGVSWANLDGNWTCHILKYNRLAETGEDVFLHSIREDAVEQIQARRIYWDPDRNDGQGAWILEDGAWVVFEPEVNRKRSSRRISQVEAPITETPTMLFAMAQRPDTKPADQLAEDIARAAARGLPAGPYWVSWHAKYAIPALNFVMIWLAIPFAMRVRRGGLAIGFGMSLTIAMTYLVLFAACMALGQGGHLPPVVAAWAPNAVFFALGLILYARTPT